MNGVTQAQLIIGQDFAAEGIEYDVLAGGEEGDHQRQTHDHGHVLAGVEEGIRG